MTDALYLPASYRDKPEGAFYTAADDGPEPEPRGVLAGDQLLPREIMALLLDHNWSGLEACVFGIAVCGAESLRFTEAVGGPWPNVEWCDYGLWQLSGQHAGPLGLTQEQFKAKAFDPVWATSFARVLYRGANYRWQPWAAFNNGSYKRFLKGAAAGAINGWAPTQGLTPTPLVKLA